MRYDQFFRSLPKQLSPLYLFVGEDAVRVEEGIRRLAAHAGKLWGGAPEMIWLDGADPQALMELGQRLEEILGGPTLFAPGRVAAVRRLSAARSGVREALGSVLEFLKRWEQTHSPNCVLVLWLLSKREGLPGQVVEFPRMYATPPPWQQGAGPGESELAAWVSAHARTRFSKRMSPQAAQLLIDASGENPDLLSREVANLAAYAGREPRIEEADVEALVGLRHPAAAWALGKPLSRLDREGLLGTLRDLFGNGMEIKGGRLEISEREIAVPVVAALAGFAWDCARAAEGSQGGPPSAQALSAAGITHRRRQEEVLSALRLRVPVPWDRWLSILADLDRDLKRDGGPPRALLEFAIDRMLSAARGGKA